MDKVKELLKKALVAEINAGNQSKSFSESLFRVLEMSAYSFWG